MSRWWLSSRTLSAYWPSVAKSWVDRRMMTPTMQKKIRRLCQECGGFYGAALWEVMCTKESVTSISMRSHVSESQLYDMRKKFYEAW